MAVAVRIARAHTGKEKIAHNGYHGWTDSFLASTHKHIEGLTRRGVPSQLFGTAMPFQTWEDLASMVANHDLAAIVMEIGRDGEPDKQLLESVRDLCTTHNIVLIFDEITSGFRFRLGGLHLNYGINPDIAVFAKAMSNGYAMAAVIGNSIMEAANDTFISSTSWTERIGPSAAVATIQKFWANDVQDLLKFRGEQMQGIWRHNAMKSGLQVTISGMPALSHIDFGSPEVLTLYTQLMLEQGFLAGKDFYPSYAHTQEDMEDLSEVVREVFPILQKAKDLGTVKAMLKGPVAQKGFQRL